MSTAYQNLTPAQLREEYAAVKAQFDALKAKELKLNMARGKPGARWVPIRGWSSGLNNGLSVTFGSPTTSAKVR